VKIGEKRREMDIDDIDEMQGSNEIYLKKLHPYNCESASSIPRTQGPLSFTPSLSVTSSSKYTE
jgi:hypothetical protein